jgi:hypothetical protein
MPAVSYKCFTMRHFDPPEGAHFAFFLKNASALRCLSSATGCIFSDPLPIPWCLPSKETMAIAGEVSAAETKSLRKPTIDFAHWMDGVGANCHKVRTVDSRALLPIRGMNGGMTLLLRSRAWGAGLARKNH